ncbi:hypothetical protein FR932_19910 [Moritella marina ATCC 15381]|uniref:Uncharacterized protein n=1 Tax=Moritella marina ATCC 15381 TaxID=1202962 RepID=A0A5J6WPN2_MORMI|nr:gamma-mobile-trio protein GmtX [Moritella marina]QFI39917.1 hypothetical protein FR932_19910 [Moritella marina ATCC 15381]
MKLDEKLEKLVLESTAKTGKSLTTLHNICKEQYERGSLDFTIATIGRLSGEVGGPKENAIRNKTRSGDKYKTLLEAWQNEYKKKARPRAIRKKDQWAEDIQDHQTRWLALDLINENRKLHAENLKYKEVKVLQIDMRKPPLTTGKTIAAREEKKANIEFTASELKSLSHAISEECFDAFGLSKDSRGRVAQDGQEMFKVGFVGAIEKILDAYAIEEK